MYVEKCMYVIAQLDSPCEIIISFFSVSCFASTWARLKFCLTIIDFPCTKNIIIVKSTNSRFFMLYTDMYDAIRKNDYQ